MTDDVQAEIEEHLFLVGAICSGWAHLEFLVELALWWQIDFLHRRTEGRVLTGSLSLEIMAKKVCELYHLKIPDKNDRKILDDVRDRIVAILDERNLAVHGVRQINPANETHAEIARGKYKNKPQKLSNIRLKSLNFEIVAIVQTLEPVLVKYRVLEDRGDYQGPPLFLRPEPEGS
jgi:hypothetical protein